MRPTGEQIGFALVLILIGVALKLAAGISFGFGPDDVRRFEAAPFGSRVGVDTPSPFLTWSRGDGMAFYALASDLDADGPARELPPDPAYRMTRIGYSLAARGISLVPGISIASGLAAVNLIALGGLGALAPRLVSRYGDRALLLYLNPAIWYAVAFDTAEALGMLLLLAAITRPSVGTWAGAGLLGITRPSLGVALPCSRSPVLSTVIAVGSALGLQLWVSSQGIEPTNGAGNLTLPLFGYMRAIPQMAATAVFVAAVVLIGCLAASVGAYKWRQLPAGTRVAMIATSALVLSLGPQVIDRPENLLRAAAALPVVLIIGASLRDQPTASPSV